MRLAALTLRASRAGLRLQLPLVRGELSLVTVIVIAAAVLTRLPPPGRGATTQVAATGDTAPSAVAPTTSVQADDQDLAEQGSPASPPTLNVGPGPVTSALRKAPPYLSVFSLDPNGAGRPNEVKVLVSRADE